MEEEEEKLLHCPDINCTFMSLQDMIMNFSKMRVTIAVRSDLA